MDDGAYAGADGGAVSVTGGGWGDVTGGVYGVGGSDCVLGAFDEAQADISAVASSTRMRKMGRIR